VVIVIGQSAEAASKLVRPIAISQIGIRHDQHIAYTLMMPLTVTIGNEFPAGAPERSFATQNHPVDQICAGASCSRFVPPATAMSRKRHGSSECGMLSAA